VLLLVFVQENAKKGGVGHSINGFNYIYVLLVCLVNKQLLISVFF